MPAGNVYELAHILIFYFIPSDLVVKRNIANPHLYI